MNDKQKDGMKQQVRDILGLPFYDKQSRELTDINDHVEGVLDELMDAFTNEVCGNCEFSCNESNCGKRHNN